ncbi:WhiB family transcriptional regulator [Pseudonocardia dioxanivorans]|uniref:WhiB family transcriptional regulator n=1 Tax=Pseudonocardia dioxanivorans TaxID=240495 RepID=UPI000A01129D
MSARRHDFNDWRLVAACREVDPDLFFPAVDSGLLFEEQAVVAKEVCRVCPVRKRCLEFALQALPEGIAGGTTPDERVALRRSRGIDLDVDRIESIPPAGLRERAAAGRRAAAGGATATELMHRFGVVRGTAHRWHAEAHRPAVAEAVTGEGSPAATGAPLRISTACEALAGNTTPEGHRS